jgi:hypothetical protein
MALEWLMPQTELDGHVAHMAGVQGELKKHAEEIKVKAVANLAAVRASTTHTKIDEGRAHETKIVGPEHAKGKYGSVDWEVAMEGEDPMALEFGHTASGYFSRERFPTAKSPHGVYILTGAAGLGELQVIPSGMARGKRGPVYGER